LVPDSKSPLRRDSLLYWAALPVPLGVTLIGVIAAIYPGLASMAFGIPVADPNVSAYVRIAGVRDIVFGLALLALLMGDHRSAAATVFTIAILIPICDGLVVLGHVGFALPILMHWGAAVYMGFVAYFLRSSRT
jgi:hypothetical protein